MALIRRVTRRQSLWLPAASALALARAGPVPRFLAIGTSDVLRAIRARELRRAFAAVTSLVGWREARRLLSTNPRRVVQGEAVEGPPAESEESEVSVMGIVEDGM